MPPTTAPTAAGSDQRLTSALVEVTFWLVALLCAYHFSVLHLRLPEWSEVDFARLVEGTAQTPMQYRVLVPWLVAGLQSLPVPALADASLESYRFGVSFASVVLLLVAVRLHLAALLGRHRPAAALALLVAPVLPSVYLLGPIAYHYCYDLPAVALFTAGLTLLYRERWWAYYPLFAVATLNRETSCFLAVAFLVWMLGRRRLAWVAGHVAFQAVLWSAIKIGLWRAYRDNTDPVYCDRFDLFRDCLAVNVELLADHSTLPFVASVFGYLLIPAVLLAPVARHPFVSRTLWVVPVWLTGMFAVGELLELRIYAELLGIVVPAFLVALWRIARDEAPARAAGPPAEAFTGATAGERDPIAATHAERS